MRRNRPNPLLLMIAIVLALCAPADASADEIGGGSAASDSTRSMGHALGVGMLAGAASFTGGFLVGALMFNDAGGEDAALEAGLVLGSTLFSVGMPLGIHHGNGARGHGLLVVGSSLAVGAAGWALALGTGTEVILPLTAVAQVVASLAVERATTPKTAPAPRVTVGPATIGGRPGFVVVGRF